MHWRSNTSRPGRPKMRAGNSKPSWRTIRRMSQRTFSSPASIARLGLKHEAEKTYRAGIVVASKAGDSHTQSELEGALESLLME